MKNKSNQAQAEQMEKIKQTVPIAEHTLESAYVYHAYIVSHVNVENKNSAQSDNNKKDNGRCSKQRFLQRLCLLLLINHSPWRKLKGSICLKMIGYYMRSLLGSLGVFPHSPAVVNAVLDSCLSSVDCCLDFMWFLRVVLMFG